MSERRFPYPIHPMALLFPPKTEEEMAVTKSNMVCRQEQGLPPIHDPLQLLDDQVLDGRHRQQAWQELAVEGACGGYFAKEEPPITVVTGDTLKAWLVVESGNLCHRHLPPDQKTAILLKAAEDYPEVGERIKEIRKANDRRMKSGQPSRTGTEGSSTAATIGRMVGVSASTVETVQRVQRDAPEEFEKVVTGKARAKAVVTQLRKNKTTVSEAKKESPNKPKQEPAGPVPLLDANVGDSVLTILPYNMGSGDVKIQERIVKEVRGGEYFFEDGLTLKKDQAFVDAQAMKARKQELQRAIKMLEEEVANLKAALKQDGEILEPKKRGRGRPPKNPAA